MRGTLLKLVAVILALTLFTAVPVGAQDDKISEPDPAAETYFIVHIQFLRIVSGLNPLYIDNGMTGAARVHSERIAGWGELIHGDHGQLFEGVPPCTIYVGENIGTAGESDKDGMMKAFVDSQPHYENILNPRWTHLAVGLVYNDGRMWTTQRFAQSCEAPLEPQYIPRFVG